MIKSIFFSFFLWLSWSVSFGQEQASFYFESNQFQLKNVEIIRLNKWISDNPKVKIVGIYGYTDEDGSIGYNDTLAQKRVQTIYEIVKNKLVIRDDFKTRSFGKLHQQSANKAENRRVTIFYLLEKDIPRENEILGIVEVKSDPKPKPKRQYPDIIEVRNPDGTLTQIELDRVFMERVDQAQPGEKLKLENLNFHLNTFAIVKESRGKLYEILMVMQQNQDISIDIQGHICCMTNDRNNLSSQRAKAIWQFLMMNGIDKSRLSYKGFGVSQPLFPISEKNEEERAANRRVEIEIIKN
jgi:outer membrane protein OmpA-like peptidoglycan-associated protein